MDLLGKGLPIPKKKGVAEKGNIWFPSTPEMSILQRSNYAPSSSLHQDLNLLISPSNPTPKDSIASLGFSNNTLHHDSNPLMAYGSKTKSQTNETANNHIFYPKDVQHFRTMHKFGSYGHENSTSVTSSSVQELGEARLNWVGAGPTSNCRRGNNQVAYSSSKPQVLHSNGDTGSCDMQETTKGTLNLNLPPTSETDEPSDSPRPFPFVPVTPGPQKQSETYQISLVPNSLTQGIPTQEKCGQDHSEILTPSEAVAANGNSETDLNQTPPQKQPKRKKHRPKVIREGKPKQIPTPAANKKSQTPNGNSKARRKSTPKNGIDASDTPSTNTINATETSNGEPGFAKMSKSCKRRLNFDSENRAKRVSQDSQAQNKEGDNKLPFNLNLEPHNSDCPTELTGPSTSMGNKNNFFQLNNKVTPQDSLALISMTPPKNHPLNAISRILNMQNSSDWCMNNLDLGPMTHQEALAQVQLCSEQVAPPKTSKSLTVVTNCNMSSASERDRISIPVNAIMNSDERVEMKRPMPGKTLSDKGPAVDKRLQLEAKNKTNYKNSTKKDTGFGEEMMMISIDYITNFLNDLHLWKNNGESELVPYKGNGAVVPYEEFDPVKKRRARPRVDLDPESDRLWNLLMGKEGSESAETMDNNKQKWWEEERKVFRGRVDSFIARMHLVQGDRRFSEWKGSVVNSLIGVFLTQNVSDHLSSSAFMSLAARFPLKPSTACPPFGRNGGRKPVQHHEVRITYPDGTTYKQKIPREPAISIESSEHRANNVTTEKRDDLSNCHTKKTEEDIISSQGSLESFVFQAYEDIRSSSGSNSEGDDVWNLGKNLRYLSEPYGGIMGGYKRLLLGHQQSKNQGLTAPANNSAYSDPFVSKVPCNQHSSGLEKWEEELLGFSGNEHISTLASTELEITNQSGVKPAHDYIGQSSERTFGGLENGPPKFQPVAVNPAIDSELKNDSRDKSGNKIGQKSFQQETSFLTDSTRPAEAFNEQPSCTTYEPAKGRVHSSEEHVNNIDSANPNARKRKAEKEKVEPFDWDILRKETQSKSGTRERCRDNMDSIDYEALRNADVHEISKAIKERGMNNMLAERMKSFLNRVVQDHGKIDLEWLRDADPDKTKDYLLSIRGLGLKSVECVRLLTLHHLAFPVDTNVGRIAVRLGWVPLQPLPESLQLHLLELYPVQETIQKYLWPRLCKLDQETLYELHYQMITFGKVFCTKREPNCNGCPMRGECRHFASAFASARLSLPGTEEKRMVPSVAAPVTPNKGPDVTITPMLLNSTDGNRDWGIQGLTRNWEPLIEEPSSPEPPMEVSERDIEDAFYEDPDEIPTIKLNAQEFTTNLKNFMQEQMELGEVEMSKALVALSPEFASIPIPKLKHVSRLRTEHQVYELPDSHPLLKGMDRREADDPSPYLLAIWTPGETADSTQPPESTCSSQECGGGGLCNNETCFSCNSSREAQAQTVRGTILVPCRTAMRGNFPLNGTYFQVNEVFADHESSLKPIEVARNLIWNLPRRKVFFGSSVTSIFKGMTTEAIQHCFWKGFICVRGFDQKSRAPKPLRARLHMLASKAAKKNE